ncbi:MAG: glutamate 5-kinase [Candidatus Bathyarchaeia archaeon]|nr:glutamate 5-kinase [Candidatus Bathyarchaeota archaeon]
MIGKLIVVKIGTSSLTKSDGNLDLDAMRELTNQIAEAVKRGYQIILVTSGAIASGIAELDIKPNPNDIVFKQACAAVGQGILMAHYRDLFKQHGLKIAQVLLTKEDLANRISYIHTCNVLDKLLSLGVVPVINENDVTSVDEIMPIMRRYKVNFSDNDILSVLIANAVQADLVIILSNIDGLCDVNPSRKKGARVIPIVEKITPELREIAEGKSALGRGGMKTKLEAAEIAMQSGIPLVVANSRRKNVLIDILEGKRVGTYFKPTGKMSGIEKWIAYGAGAKGQIKVNEGAKQAILKGASLLAAGIESISGQFKIGDVVSIMGPDDKEFARGIVNYSSEEINLIKGLKTTQIKKVLGYIRRKEVIVRKLMHIVGEVN